MDFIARIKERAKADKKTIVLAEGEELRTVQAADKILKAGTANIILLGDENKIMENAKGLDISGAEVINPLKSDKLQDFAQKFYEMRKKKGISEEDALNTVKGVLYFGVMMVKEGLADGMVAGAVNATANVMRPALQILKTAPGTKLVSAFFVMKFPFVTSAHGTYNLAEVFRFFTNWGQRTISVSNDIKKYLTENYHIPEEHVFMVDSSGNYPGNR